MAKETETSNSYIACNNAINTLLDKLKEKEFEKGTIEYYRTSQEVACLIEKLAWCLDTVENKSPSDKKSYTRKVMKTLGYFYY